METDLHQDLSESNMVFVPAGLDDAGLSVHAFRVYCHLARRTLHSRRDKWPSAPTIAGVCRMNEDTVWRALKELIDQGMVHREKRDGTSSRHWLTKPSEWTAKPETAPAAPKTRRKRGGGGKEGAAESKGQGAAESRGQGAAESRGYEGTPCKVHHEGIAGGSVDPSAVGLGADAPNTAPTTDVQTPKPAVPAGEKKPRRHNPAFDALVEIEGGGDGMTKVEGGKIGKALSEIREAWPIKLPAEPTPDQRDEYEQRLADEIRRRARQWRDVVMPFATCTATGLAAHWSKCAAVARTGIGVPLPSQGGRFALPDGCDFRAIATRLGLRVPFDTPWHELSHETRGKILEAHASDSLIS